MAAAVGIPIVALFESSAYFRETGPYGSGHWIIQSGQLLEYAERTEAEMQALHRIPVGNVLTAVDALLSKDPAMPSLDGPANGEGHYRSLWSNGAIDYLPAAPVAMKAEDLCARLQKPIWLASLNGREVNPDQAAEDAMGTIRKYFTEASVRAVPETLRQFQKEALQTEGLLLRLQSRVDSALQKLNRNPAHLFSEGQLSEITSLEQAVQRSGQSMAVQPFVCYFDAALATTKGTNTRE